MEYDCLVIDDEKMLADSTVEYFNLSGVKAAAVYDALSCQKFLKENTARLLLLDINLGDDSGFKLCKELRKEMQIPILFISARTSDDDKLVAFHIGGDDYVEKPYSLSVLLAKVKVMLKRFGQGTGVKYSDSWLTVDFDSRQVLAGGNPALMSISAKSVKQLNVIQASQNILLQCGVMVINLVVAGNEKKKIFCQFAVCLFSRDCSIYIYGLLGYRQPTGFCGSK